MHEPPFALLDTNPVCQQQLHALAKRLNLPIAESEACADLLLFFDVSSRLSIVDNGNPRSKPFFVDLDSTRQNSGKDPLMRAIGYNTRSVVDCTAGWGVDAAHIARRNIRVQACENHPIVYALINDALGRSVQTALRDCLSLHHTHSLDFLSTLQNPPEVIYLDPMYPPKTGSAAPKRALQFLRRIHMVSPIKKTTAMDEIALVTRARQIASQRVVVKRPRYAPPIVDRRSGEISTKLLRFDLYAPT